MSLCVITGPMFSGKTTTLLSKIRECTEQNGSTSLLCIKPSVDDRYATDKIVTHKGSFVECITTPDLSSLKIPPGKVNIFIDECQFFPDLLNFVQLHSEKNITVAGLSEDFKQEQFGQTSDVFKTADQVLLLQAHCAWCLLKTAKHTVRLSTATYEPQVRIGNNNYFPVCGECLVAIRAP